MQQAPSQMEMGLGAPKRTADAAALPERDVAMDSVVPTALVFQSINATLAALGAHKTHVSEVFCPGRFTERASALMFNSYLHLWLTGSSL